MRLVPKQGRRKENNVEDEYGNERGYVNFLLFIFLLLFLEKWLGSTRVGWKGFVLNLK